MQNVLQTCRANFGEAPRRISLWDRLNYFRVPKPPWLDGDPLMTLFQNLSTVYSHGTVVWGYIIQANNLMFKPGEDNCPADLVFSFDDPSRVGPAELHAVAQALYQLKETEPEDPQLRRIAEHLTGEMTRVFGWPVPEAISPAIRCKISTTFLVRKHLPLRRLCSPIFPVVVRPREPHVAMPLPERYWPPELVAWWTQQ